MHGCKMKSLSDFPVVGRRVSAVGGARARTIYGSESTKRPLETGQGYFTIPLSSALRYNQTAGKYVEKIEDLR